MSLVTAGVAGLLFAIGLVIGGMTDPAKVIAFLDVTGDWDPSLAFVMGGAILVYAPAARILSRGPRARFAPAFLIPTGRSIDARLGLGAVLFGVGWGLSGLCPGPAIVALMSFSPSVLLFGASMMVGMVVFAAVNRRWNADDRR